MKFLRTIKIAFALRAKTLTFRTNDANCPQKRLSQKNTLQKHFYIAIKIKTQKIVFQKVPAIYGRYAGR